MEYIANNNKMKVQNTVFPLTSGVKLKGGKLKEAFQNNISFINSFDVDRMLYWYRVVEGKASPSAPYSYGSGHFEDNLHGQSAALFLMTAGTTLMWQEDEKLRKKMNSVVEQIAEFGQKREDGCLFPIPESEYYTKEYPNYVRAWIYFGLIASGNAGNKCSLSLVRKFGDWFNQSECLSYVKDMNLGFQGILANTELYLSGVGIDRDLEVAQKYYREDWWLDWIDKEQQRAIYQKPGDHPHGTLLTTLEAYLDLYRITGEKFLLNCVQKALKMYEKKWQHVGGGIVMCESNTYGSHFPGCNLLSHTNAYNELCCSTFWVLLNQRMHLLFPDEVHYVDQFEQSIYNVLLACQEKDLGYRYHAWIDGTKDDYTNKVSCCAATGSRLCAMLPQFLFTCNDDEVYIDMYADSEVNIKGSKIRVKSNMPYSGNIQINILEWRHKRIKLRIPTWCTKSSTVNGKNVNPGTYYVIDHIQTGYVILVDLDFGIKVTKYIGAERKPDKDRYAIEYGPLLLAALRRNAFIKIDTKHFSIKKTKCGRYQIDGNKSIEFCPYMDISDQPFTVYPFVE